jgi:KDO2-lipid IV(A) lauroyltransferase
MKLKKYRIVQMLEFAAAMLAALPFLVLPRKLAFRLGEWVGTAMFWLMPRRRAIGFRNLDIAFGNELSVEEKTRILRLTFKNLGKSLAEILQFSKMSREYIRQKHTIIGQEHYLAAREQGKGVIFLTAHIGNWEMALHIQSAAGYPLNIVVRPLDNPYLDRLMTKRREMFGSTVLARRNGLKYILAALRKQETVGILMDQNTLRSRGIFVDFFGKPACTIPVIALLALRYHVPVIPGFLVRTGFDTHTLYFHEEVEIIRTGDTQNDIKANTARFNAIIEEFIRKYPDQWFWIHNRWKSQPDKS